MLPTTDQYLQPEMEPTERLLWSGRPPQGLRLGKGELPVLLMGALWLAIVAYAAWNLYGDGEALSEYVPLAIPAFIGLYLIVGRPIADAYARASTFYGISDRRVLILREKPARKLLAIELVEMGEPSLESWGMDSGEIRLGGDSEIYRQQGRRRRRVTVRGPSFQLEKGAHNAFETLRRAREDARRG